jgi:hypothetical protein
MAAVTRSGGTNDLINTDLALVNNGHKCIYCEHLQRELTNALLELQ